MIKFLFASIATTILLGGVLNVLGTETEVMASSSPDDTAVIGTSVNRSNKSDRVRVTRPEDKSSSANKTISSKRSPPGCEPAFSPFADPGRPNLLNYCQT
jgi:hypothetical protein